MYRRAGRSVGGRDRPGTAAEAASEGPALGDSAAVSALAEREREILCVGERKREKKVVTGRLIEIIQVTAKPRIS